MYGETDAHPSGYGQGNLGFSGTPLWKLKQQTNHQLLVQAAQQQYLDEQKALEAEKVRLDEERSLGQRLFVDAVFVPGKSGQQLVRHVLVKDLQKVAGALNIRLPNTGIFSDSGQRALFALFDSQGTLAASKVAETCCRQLPVKLLRNLASLPVESCNPTFVKASLLRTFEDLEQDLTTSGINDRCGVSLALVVGSWLFSAVFGQCGAVMYQGNGREYAVTSFTAASASPSFSSPEVQSTQILWGDLEPFFLLTGTPVKKAVTVQEMLEISLVFAQRPRAVSGEIVAKALQTHSDDECGPDCTVIAGFFKRPSVSVLSKRSDAPAKRARTDKHQPAMESVRLRHIVMRYKDCKQPLDPVKNKGATRTREEAEAALRSALAELLQDGNHCGDSMWAAQSTPRILKMIRACSECKSALKGGSNCGDLGWLGKKELEKMGKDGFAEPIKALGIAEWSDLLFSEQGVHLVMRIT
mmetsp:Transcript_43818/g.115748  ORF Transcript_43818/g.115748 Transcript_43818/m.115748 type:complete len:470 (-) Transcript_43818:268-1677(-)